MLYLITRLHAQSSNNQHSRLVLLLLALLPRQLLIPQVALSRGAQLVVLGSPKKADSCSLTCCCSCLFRLLCFLQVVVSRGAQLVVLRCK
jgi:hypothetical protein